MLRFHVGSLVVVALAGCDANTQTTLPAASPETTADILVPAPATVSSGPPAMMTSAAPAPNGSPLVGTWSSTSCGERKYARTIRFDDKGGFTASDLVSPCPPDAKCIWSGIVERKGSYVTTGNIVKLTVDGGTKGPGAPFPETLEASPVPTETQGAIVCSYSRAGL